MWKYLYKSLFPQKYEEAGSLKFPQSVQEYWNSTGKIFENI